MNHARAERRALCALLDAAGPNAPTLCEGWTTYDLVAHLVLRERRPDAAGGVVVKPLAGYTARVQDSLKAKHDYSELVDLVRRGPAGVYALPGADSAVNTLELFVHHEDVRRAQPAWEPRTLPADLDDVLWRRLRLLARLLVRKAPVGVELRRPDGASITAKRGMPPPVLVIGPPGELMLYAFGRKAHARVTFEGDDRAIAGVQSTPMGL